MTWKDMALPSVEDVLAECASRRSGLFSHEVKERLIRDGYNEIVSKRSPWRDFLLRRFRSSFLYLLLAASFLSFYLGDRLEALLILMFVVINVGLESYQEYHSEKSLRLLKRFLVSHVSVRRDSGIAQVESREIVPGDIILVLAGDRLATDMRFIETTGLMLDETVMTGESVPVRKQSAPSRTPKSEMSEAVNIGFAGTVVVAGKGEGVVISTGQSTALGDIATLTDEIEHESVFEKSINKFSRFILQLVLLTLFFIFLANVFLRHGQVSTGELLIFSLALAVSVIPEALPVIVTVTLSRGSLALAHQKVVVKRLSAIEELGSIEILCTDKTGTITENTLVVSEVKGKDKERALILSSVASLEIPIKRNALRDSFDLALWNALSDEDKQEVASRKRLDTLPFDPERRRNSILIQEEEKYRLIVRGAFEEVLSLANNLSQSEKKEWLQWGNEEGKKGRRVLAVAMRDFVKKVKLEASLEHDLEMVGFIAFEDPLKKTALSTIKEAEHLGLQVKVLTGDSREVAGAVSHAVGLIESPEMVVTGAELSLLSHEAKLEKVETFNVFARVSPRQKYDIIKLLQEKHEVGFLGEGINDAPALKLANVAIVVQGAADIAKEAADVILLQRNLGTIVKGVQEGRVIFANILKYLRITLTSNFGNFYSVALASLFLPFVPLLPIQILLLNLLSDFPMLAVATDNVDPSELEKPRDYRVESIVLMGVFLGGVSSFFDFVLFGVFYKAGPSVLQTAWFLLSVITEVVIIFSLRTKLLFFRAKHPAWPLILLSFVAVVIVFILPFTFFGQNVFRFIHPTQGILLFVLTLSIAYFLATELAKRFYITHFENSRSRRLGIP